MGADPPLGQADRRSLQKCGPPCLYRFFAREALVHRSPAQCRFPCNAAAVTGAETIASAVKTHECIRDFCGAEPATALATTRSSASARAACEGTSSREPRVSSAT